MPRTCGVRRGDAHRSHPRTPQRRPRRKPPPQEPQSTSPVARSVRRSAWTPCGSPDRRPALPPHGEDMRADATDRLPVRSHQPGPTNGRWATNASLAVAECAQRLGRGLTGRGTAGRCSPSGLSASFQLPPARHRPRSACLRVPRRRAALPPWLPCLAGSLAVDRSRMIVRGPFCSQGGSSAFAAAGGAVPLPFMHQQ